MVGRTLSHYRIVEKIGEGGMGVVYKARDTHLDRFVAIKLLQPHLVDDAERRRRFVQEAKAASALNHPNIVTVHDIDTAEDVTFIAMEYVAGKPLDEVLRRKGMRVGEALGYAIQVADALAAAHAAGIVHRDLKPSNIVVGDDGRVRVLDFGLAKLTQAREAAGVTATMTAAPISEAGTVLGTFAYMSPEQAQGATVDARSDVFSFGVVLYEMLAGRHPFRRESRISTLAAIVGEDPKPLSDDRAPLPAEVERTVLRCLRKEPQRRWQSMSDLKSVLEDLKEESESGTLQQPGGTAVRAPRRLRLAVVILIAGALMGASAYVWIRTRAPAVVPEIELAPLTLDAGFSGSVSVSRDGKIVVYASDRGAEGVLDIWVRNVDRPQAVRRTHDPAGAMTPSVSPDGSRIVYVSMREGGGLYIVDTLAGLDTPGGDERLLARGGLSPRFSPDGKWIAYVREVGGGLSGNAMYLISPDGGEPRPLQPGFAAALGPTTAGPIWSPDSRNILFDGFRKSDGAAGWWVAAVDGGEPVKVDTTVFPESSMARVPCAWPWPDTFIIAEGATIEGYNLVRVGVSQRPWRLTGLRRRLTAGPGIRLDPSVSADGRLVFSIITWMSQLRAVARDATSGRAVGDPQIVSQDSQTKSGAAVSADGSKVAYCALMEFVRATGLPRVELRVRDIRTGRETVASTGSAIWKRPRLNVDGSLIGYVETTPDGVAAFISSAAGETRRVCKDCRILGFFPGANDVLVLYSAGGVVRQSISGDKQTVALPAPAGTITDGRLSADGRWLAYVVRSPSGRASLYVAPMATTGRATAPPVLVDEDDAGRIADPCWSPDGSFVYYFSPRDGLLCIWARRFDPVTGRVSGDSFPALHAHSVRAAFVGGGRWNWGLGATQDRLYMLMADMKSNVWTARLTH